MRNCLKNSTFAVAFVVCLILSASAGWSRAESGTAKENLEKLKATNSCRKCDLSGLTMTRMNLSGADLEGADLSMVKFFLTNLSGANLRKSNLRGASFGGCDLGEADLRGADLRGTSLDGAYLGDTLLDGEFITAKPYEDIGVADVEKQIYIGDQNKPKKSPIASDVEVADGQDVKASSPPSAVKEGAAKLSAKSDAGAGSQTAVADPGMVRQPDAPVAKKLVPVPRAIVEPLEESEKTAEPLASGISRQENEGTIPPQKPLPQESFAESGIADLTNRLAKDKIKRDNLTRLLDRAQCHGCDLSGLDLSGRNLKNVDLEKANLTGCNLELVILDNANLKEAILRNANMRKASLQDADLHRAELSGADLTGANVDGAVLENAVTAAAVGLAVQPVVDK